MSAESFDNSTLGHPDSEEPASEIESPDPQNSEQLEIAPAEAKVDEVESPIVEPYVVEPHVAESHVDEQSSEHTSTAVGEVPLDEEGEVDVSLWFRGADWFVTNRHELSKDLDSLARSIDSFFAGKQALSDQNESFARIRIAAGYFSSRGIEDQSDTKFRLSLPATQRKLRLVVENVPEEDESLGDSVRPSNLTENSTDKEGFSAALQFATTEIQHWKTRFEVGIVARTPLDPFVRYTAKRRWEINDLWLVRFRQRLTYFRSSFYNSRSLLSFERPVAENLLYRMETRVDWKQQEDTMEAVQAFNLYQRVDAQRAVYYQFAVVGESLSHTLVNNYYVSIQMRQRLYQDWLFLDVIPELSFPREENFDSQVGVTFRLEILFKE